jgi:DNA polymerase-3 subunit delta'
MLAPRENPVLFGHTEAEAAFAAAAASGRLHHAWLLTGAPGLGKATLAFRLARLLLTREGDANDPGNPVFRRIARGTHSDVLTIERATDLKTKKIKREITVDQVRDVAGFMHLTPAEGGRRVVIVDGLEDLNRNAANALLKILEEPPKAAVLLLTSDAPGRLLPTIRSRCRQLRMEALDGAQMDAALRYLLADRDAETRAGLIAVAEGAPGQAVALADEGALVLAGLAREMIAAPRLSTLRAYDVADRVTRGEGGFETFMTLLQAAVAGAVRTAARRGDHVLGRTPLAEWGEVWHALGHLHDETERFNLDKRTAVVAGLQMLPKVE